MIDQPEQARRLAKAICTDVRLYNETAVREAAPADRTRVLAQPVSEAYELFVSRVTPEHHPIFEELVIALYADLDAPYEGLSLPVAPEPREEPRAAPHAHPPVRRVEPDEEPSSRGPPTVPMVLAMLLVIAAVAAAFALMR